MALPTKQNQECAVRKYRPEDATTFRSLNEAWIEKHFSLEADDLLMLNDPNAHIVAKGGQIYMALVDGSVAGCCALLALGDGIYELAKMAVAEQLQGRGIGRKLLEFVIADAKAIGAKLLILGSNTKLASAVHLYESFGFQHVLPEELPPSPYVRANVHMRLYL